MERKCDPNFEFTWMALYGVVPDFAPTLRLPIDRERVEERMYYFYMCYRLAKLP
jgi:hypothetical protein